LNKKYLGNEYVDNTRCDDIILSNYFDEVILLIVYRCVSERELACMIGVSNYTNAPHGKNTFDYKEDIPYKHFFYYYDSAISFMDAQNSDRYYDKYSVIMAYDINDELLNEHFGVGQYNLSCVPKTLKDSILQYFETIYYPEFAIPSFLITKDMIVGIGNRRRITPVSYVYYDDMSDAITKSEKDFLEYEKWLFEHGTNVSERMVLENRNSLFPLDITDKKL